jgi:hypothetical protein
MLSKTRNGVIALAAVGALLLCTARAGAEEVAPGLQVGDVLGPDNWEKAKGLLPPEILRHYEKGEYRNRIVSYPTGKAVWEDSFVEATKRNAETLDVDERNTIIDKRTGEQPDYYYGIPFPHIDPNDPKAGAKAVWNQFLVYWYGGSSYNRTLVVMLSPTRPEREVIANGWFHFYDGQAPKYRPENPHTLQSQFLAVSLEPADLQGTASLTWRYRASDKRDSVWAFIPALRRVRAVSPANRSDGYLGSDLSGDDGFFFDGKPEDFVFKLVGKREGLTLVDPTSVSSVLKTVPVPGGGWWALTNDNPDTVGYLTKGWTGLSWAPSGPALAKRTFWVVEAVPRDKYYLYGRLELWIDAETWNGAWNRKFSWQGELVQVYQVLARVNHPAGPAEEREWIPLNTMVYACAENFKMNRSTLGGMRPDPKAAFHRRLPIDASLFDAMALTRYSK